ncbi:MAG: MFS transporter [Fervidobacterium sp.]|uniref:MFS transporter n=1 Tax=Fervidobacterium TaxID=2422 RepID=UPI001FE3F30D|nr:MFS transporter [Fervidobacterium gondwanense]
MKKLSSLLPMIIIFSYSLVLNSMAPLLSSFRELFHISVELSSLLPFFSLTGTVLSNIFVGIYLNRLGLKRALMTGYLLTILGSLIIAFSGRLFLSLVGLFFFGLSTGFGFTASTTLLVQSKKPKFGLFHGAYGLGGIIAPLLIKVVQGKWQDFRFVYLIYSALFLSLLTYTLLKIEELSAEKKRESFSLSEIRQAFKIDSFRIFLLLLILYSSAEIGVITWAGTISNSKVISTYTAYMIFWALFTLSRFPVEYLEKTFRYLLRTNTLLLIVSTVLLFTTKNPIYFIISGFLFGPLFPYIQKHALRNIHNNIIPLFNGATYAFTSLGGNIASTLIGVLIGKSFVLALLVPVIIIGLITTLSLKTKAVK